MPADFDLPESVIMLVDVSNDGEAFKAGLKSNEWILGEYIVTSMDRESTQQGTPAEVTARKIATRESGENITLLVFNEETEKTRIVSVMMGDSDFGSRILGMFARHIPEPKTPEERFPVLVYLLVFVTIMTVVRNLLRFLQEYLVQTAVFGAMADLRCDNYNVALQVHQQSQNHHFSLKTPTP